MTSPTVAEFCDLTAGIPFTEIRATDVSGHVYRSIRHLNPGRGELALEWSEPTIYRRQNPVRHANVAGACLQGGPSPVESCSAP